MTDVLPEDSDRERDDRQRGVLGDVPHVAQRRERRPGLGLLARREEADLDGEEPDQHHARPEVGHRIEEERALDHPGVARGAAVRRRVDAEPRPDQRGEERRDADQDQRVRQRRPHHRRDRLVGLEARAEVAVERVVEVDPKLRHEALVEPALMDQPLAAGLAQARVAADQVVLRIAGDAEEEEVEDEDEDQRPERDHDLLGDGLHLPAAPGAVGAGSSNGWRSSRLRRMYPTLAMSAAVPTRKAITQVVPA